MTSHSTLFQRRRFLAWCASLSIGTASGCRKDPAPSPAETTVRRNIPLKVAIALERKRDLEDRVSAIRIAWSAVSEQPLSITPVEYIRADASALATSVLREARHNDVVIYPIAIATELVAAEAITPLPEEFSQTLDRDQGNLLPALRNRLAAYTDQTIGLPLGTSLPAILSVDPIAPVGSWKDYDQLVADTWKGKAGEPTAPGWAAAMFLWRAAHIKGWLFDRENLNPLIDSEPYVEALERFTTTHDRYQAKRQGPDEIWSGIISGSLLGGISWWHEDNANVEVNVVDLPTPSSQGKILFDPFAVMASLSSDCRQSAAAKQFIAWIAGNESSESMRRNVFGTATNRATSVRESQSALGAKQVTNYDRWLSNRLTNPITRPTLQLQDSTDYYAALDQGVGRALDHQTSAQDALSQTADKWRQITRNVGAVKQLRTWNRLQGLRG